MPHYTKQQWLKIKQSSSCIGCTTPLWGCRMYPTWDPKCPWCHVHLGSYLYMFWDWLSIAKFCSDALNWLILGFSWHFQLPWSWPFWENMRMSSVLIILNWWFPLQLPLWCPPRRQWWMLPCLYINLCILIEAAPGNMITFGLLGPQVEMHLAIPTSHPCSYLLPLPLFSYLPILLPISCYHSFYFFLCPSYYLLQWSFLLMDG